MQFPVVGLPLRALGLSARLESWLRANWEFRHTAVLSNRYAIDIVARSHAPRRLDRTIGIQQQCTLEGMALDWLRVGERAWFGRASTGAVRLDITGDRARIDLWFDRVDDVSPELLASLHLALCEALRAAGLIPLHAAVVVRDGLAVALVGRSGVGKSSTLVSMLARGWSPLCEDFAWLNPVTRRVYGWDRGVHLSDDGLARFRGQVPMFGWRRESDKHFIEFHRLIGAPVARPSSAILARIIELKRDAERDSIVGHLDARNAVRALWESAGVPLCERSRKRFTNEVPLLLRQLDIDQMVLGRTPLVI